MGAAGLWVGRSAAAAAWLFLMFHTCEGQSSLQTLGAGPLPFPTYADTTPHSSVTAFVTSTNTSWNTSVMPQQTSAFIRDPLPTGQWYSDLQDPDAAASSPTVVLPLQMRRVSCGIQVGGPAMNSSHQGRRVRSDWKPEIAVYVDQYAEQDSRAGTNAIVCTARMAKDTWGPLHVQVDNTVAGGQRAGSKLTALAVRGSPYINFQATGGSLPRFIVENGLQRVAGVQIHSAITVESSLLNITTFTGAQWMIWFPQVVKVTLSQQGFTLEQAVAGWIRIANVPSVPAAGRAAEILHRRSGCMVLGADLGADAEPSGTGPVTVELRWRVTPLGCAPLLLTAPNHRAAWPGGWQGQAGALEYPSVQGALIEAPAAAGAAWRLALNGSEDVLGEAIEVHRGPAIGGHSGLQLCERYWMYDHLITDAETATEGLNASTPLDEVLDRFYRVASYMGQARRLGAVKLNQTFRDWGVAAIAHIIGQRLVVYDRVWGGLIASEPGRLDVERPSDNYELQQRRFGRLLYGISQVYWHNESSPDRPEDIPFETMQLAYASIQTIMSPPGSRYYAAYRNFDWYLGTSWAGGVVRATGGRVTTHPGDALLGWYAARLVANRLRNVSTEMYNVSRLGSALYAQERLAVQAYWLAEGGAAGITASIMEQRSSSEARGGGTSAALEPVGPHWAPLGQALAVAARRVDQERRTAALRSNDTVPVVLNGTAMQLAATFSPHSILQLIEARTAALTRAPNQGAAAVVEWAAMALRFDNATVPDCYALFPQTWEGSLALRVHGKSLWYGDSFHYQIRAVHYEPTTLGRNPHERSVYEFFYNPLHERDMLRIKAGGFNTVKVAFRTGLRELRSFCAEAYNYGLNVIVAFDTDQWAAEEANYISEQQFMDVVDVLGDKKNVIMWTITSAAFEGISADKSVLLLRMMRQLKRLRDKFDSVIRRPIMSTFSEFGMQQLITGGTTPVDVYTDTVEVVEVSVLELNELKLRALLVQVEHPVLVNLWGDSWYAINRTRDEHAQAVLTGNDTSLALTLHREHETLGVVITEWEDEWWRGILSDPDNDCPDPRHGRQVDCGRRVIHFQDGELQLEHLGIMDQFQTWFQHCIRPKQVYFHVARVFLGAARAASLPRTSECQFVFLTEEQQWILIITSAVFGSCGFLLLVYQARKMLREKTAAETRGAHAGQIRWVQPNTAKIARTVVQNTMRLPTTVKQFKSALPTAEAAAVISKINRRSLGINSLYTLQQPLTGEWQLDGDGCMSEADRWKDLPQAPHQEYFFPNLRWVPRPNRDGYVIKGLAQFKAGTGSKRYLVRDGLAKRIESEDTAMGASRRQSNTSIPYLDQSFLGESQMYASAAPLFNIVEDQEGTAKVVDRMVVEFTLRPDDIVDDNDQDDLRFRGIWELCKYRPTGHGEYGDGPQAGVELTEDDWVYHQTIRGGRDCWDTPLPDVLRDLPTGWCLQTSDPLDEHSWEGEFRLEPCTMVDPWDENRWRCIEMQLDRLQMLIYDEMLCQSRMGRGSDFGDETDAFHRAVRALYSRYLCSFYGWIEAQNAVGGKVDQIGTVEDFVDTARAIDPPKSVQKMLGELLGLLTIWQMGEHMTWFSGHWLHWNLYYFLGKERFPPSRILSDTRHIRDTPTTFDDVNESCCLTPYYDVPEKVADDDDLLDHEKRPQSLLLPDGTYNNTLADTFPFRKTWMEPRKWGVLFVMVHNAFFVFHATFLSFAFWVLIVFFSEEQSRGVNAVFSRTYDVWNKQTDDMMFIIIFLCKMDFWLLVIYEVAEIWIALGMSSLMDTLGRIPSEVCAWTGMLCMRCRCCCPARENQLQDQRRSIFWEIVTCRATKETFKMVCARMRQRQFIALRWHGYFMIAVWLIVMSGSWTEDERSFSRVRIAVYCGMRVAVFLLHNLLLHVFPQRIVGAPPDLGKPRSADWASFLISVIFWLGIYVVVEILRAWLVFRTDNTGFVFCGCDTISGSQADASGLALSFWSKVRECGEKQPRCFVAIALIWTALFLMFFIATHAGFLGGVLVVGGIKHLLMQWRARKVRTLLSHKMETKYLLRSINVRLLGFTDPRDNSVARKVWNRVIEAMWEEDILSHYEYETMQIHAHVPELHFSVDNVGAKARLSSFLEYLHAATYYSCEALGPVSCYPSASVVIPVFNESLMADKDALNQKVHGNAQHDTQLYFLADNYKDEWTNFVETSVVGKRQLFHRVLSEDIMQNLMQDYQNLVQEVDYAAKRKLKPDTRLRDKAAKRVLEFFHMKPDQFEEPERNAIWWWASMRMQTVARTVRGVERNREAIKFLLELEIEYTGANLGAGTGKTSSNAKDPSVMAGNRQYAEQMAKDKVQCIVALQRLASNEWYSANRASLMTLWRRFPMMQIVFDVPCNAVDYKDSREVIEKVERQLGDLYYCVDYASCHGVWDRKGGPDGKGSWHVDQAIGRRNQLRVEKKDAVKWGITGPIQGKSANQAHVLPFCRGQIVQALDCNQDGYFEESLKLRSLFNNFFPTLQDRIWTPYKVVGHPEYVITSRSGVVGQYAGYAEYIFNSLVQRVLNVLGVRMHYGHPDYFDASWIVTQSGMSKPNPRLNLNEDIFAGFHIKASGERTLHVDDVHAGKGRETNFDGAHGFEQKLGMGAAMQFRTRDHYDLMRFTNIFQRHSLFYGTIGQYLFMGMLFLLIYCTLLVHVWLAIAGKTDHELQQGDSPYGSEWMVQMSLLETLPLLVQLTLDYGIWGFVEGMLNFGGVTYFFLFIFLTKVTSFWSSMMNGSAHYVATGRTDPLFRRSFRHMWRMYGHTHFLPACLLFILWVLNFNMSIDQTSLQTFWRTVFHFFAWFIWLCGPVLFNPALSVKGLFQDLKKFSTWVFGDSIQRIKLKNDPVQVIAKRWQSPEDQETGMSSPRAAKTLTTAARKKAGDELMRWFQERLRREGAYPHEEYWDSDGPHRDSVAPPSGDDHNPLRTGLHMAPEPPGGDFDYGDIVTPSIDTAPPDQRPKTIIVPQGAIEKSDMPVMLEYDQGGYAGREAGGETPFQQENAQLGIETGALAPQQRAPLRHDMADSGGMSGELTMEMVRDRLVHECGLDERPVDTEIRRLEVQWYEKCQHRQRKEDYIEGTDPWALPLKTFQKIMIRQCISVSEKSMADMMNVFPDGRDSLITFPEFLVLYMHIKLCQIGQDAKLQTFAFQELDDGFLSPEDAERRVEQGLQRYHAMRRNKKVRVPLFFDSTHVKDSARTECLKHHLKVTTILTYRGTSTTGRVVLGLIELAVWFFIYCTMWQECLWQFMYILLALTCDWLLCIPDKPWLSILTHVFVFVFLAYRSFDMLSQERVFLITILLVFWFHSIIIHLTFAVWAAFGPYMLGRTNFKQSMKIDSQREECLIMLLKDRREQYLFAFPWYFLVIQMCAIWTGVVQFFFSLVLLFIRVLIGILLWLLAKLGKHFARRRATQTTFSGTKGKDEAKEEHGSALKYDMLIQTEQFGLWDEERPEKATQVGAAYGQGELLAELQPPGVEMAHYDMPPDALDTVYPDVSSPSGARPQVYDWIPGGPPPGIRPEVSDLDDELDPHYIYGKDGKKLARKAGAPRVGRRPPPVDLGIRPEVWDVDGDLPTEFIDPEEGVEWLRECADNDWDLPPEWLPFALDGDLAEDIPVEWLRLAAEGGVAAAIAKRQAKKKKVDDLPATLLKLAQDDKLPTEWLGDDQLEAIMLNLDYDGDLPPEWLALAKARKDKGMTGRELERQVLRLAQGRVPAPLRRHVKADTGEVDMDAVCLVLDFDDDLPAELLRLKQMKRAGASDDELTAHILKLAADGDLPAELLGHADQSERQVDLGAVMLRLGMPSDADLPVEILNLYRKQRAGQSVAKRRRELQALAAQGRLPPNWSQRVEADLDTAMVELAFDEHWQLPAEILNIRMGKEDGASPQELRKMVATAAAKGKLPKCSQDIADDMLAAVILRIRMDDDSKLTPEVLQLKKQAGLGERTKGAIKHWVQGTLKGKQAVLPMERAVRDPDSETPVEWLRVMDDGDLPVEWLQTCPEKQADGKWAKEPPKHGLRGRAAHGALLKKREQLPRCDDGDLPPTLLGLGEKGTLTGAKREEARRALAEKAELLPPRLADRMAEALPAIMLELDPDGNLPEELLRYAQRGPPLTPRSRAAAHEAIMKHQAQLPRRVEDVLDRDLDAHMLDWLHPDSGLPAEVIRLAEQGLETPDDRRRFRQALHRNREKLPLELQQQLDQELDAVMMQLHDDDDLPAELLQFAEKCALFHKADRKAARRALAAHRQLLPDGLRKRLDDELDVVMLALADIAEGGPRDDLDPEFIRLAEQCQVSPRTRDARRGAVLSRHGQLAPHLQKRVDDALDAVMLQLDADGSMPAELLAFKEKGRLDQRDRADLRKALLDLEKQDRLPRVLKQYVHPAEKWVELDAVMLALGIDSDWDLDPVVIELKDAKKRGVGQADLRAKLARARAQLPPGLRRVSDGDLDACMLLLGLGDEELPEEMLRFAQKGKLKPREKESFYRAVQRAAQGGLLPKPLMKHVSPEDGLIDIDAVMLNLGMQDDWDLDPVIIDLQEEVKGSTPEQLREDILRNPDRLPRHLRDQLKADPGAVFNRLNIGEEPLPDDIARIARKGRLGTRDQQNLARLVLAHYQGALPKRMRQFVNPEQRAVDIQGVMKHLGCEPDTGSDEAMRSLKRKYRDGLRGAEMLRALMDHKEDLPAKARQVLEKDLEGIARRVQLTDDLPPAVKSLVQKGELNAADRERLEGEIRALAGRGQLPPNLRRFVHQTDGRVDLEAVMLTFGMDDDESLNPVVIDLQEKKAHGASEAQLRQQLMSNTDKLPDRLRRLGERNPDGLMTRLGLTALPPELQYFKDKGRLNPLEKRELVKVLRALQQRGALPPAIRKDVEGGLDLDAVMLTLGVEDDWGLDPVILDLREKKKAGASDADLAVTMLQVKSDLPDAVARDIEAALAPVMTLFGLDDELTEEMRAAQKQKQLSAAEKRRLREHLLDADARRQLPRMLKPHVNAAHGHVDMEAASKVLGLGEGWHKDPVIAALQQRRGDPDDTRKRLVSDPKLSAPARKKVDEALAPVLMRLGAGAPLPDDLAPLAGRRALTAAEKERFRNGLARMADQGALPEPLKKHWIPPQQHVDMDGVLDELGVQRDWHPDKAVAALGDMRRQGKADSDIKRAILQLAKAGKLPARAMEHVNIATGEVDLDEAMQALGHDSWDLSPEVLKLRDMRRQGYGYDDIIDKVRSLKDQGLLPKRALRHINARTGEVDLPLLMDSLGFHDWDDTAEMQQLRNMKKDGATPDQLKAQMLRMLHAGRLPEHAMHDVQNALQGGGAPMEAWKAGTCQSDPWQAQDKKGNLHEYDPAPLYDPRDEQMEAEMFQGGPSKDDDELVGEVLDIAPDRAVWGNEAEMEQYDWGRDGGDDAAMQDAVPEMIYFREDEPGASIFFVEARDFDNIRQFRQAVRSKLKFKGPLEQVILSVRKSGTDTRGDTVELDDSGTAWPPGGVTQGNPIKVSILRAANPTQKKKMKIRTNQLRMKTDIEKRLEKRRGDASPRRGAVALPGQLSPLRDRQQDLAGTVGTRGQASPANRDLAASLRRGAPQDSARLAGSRRWPKDAFAASVAVMERSAVRGMPPMPAVSESPAGSPLNRTQAQVARHTVEGLRDSRIKTAALHAYLGGCTVLMAVVGYRGVPFINLEFEDRLEGLGRTTGPRLSAEQAAATGAKVRSVPRKQQMRRFTWTRDGVKCDRVTIDCPEVGKINRGDVLISINGIKIKSTGSGAEDVQRVLTYLVANGKLNREEDDSWPMLTVEVDRADRDYSAAGRETVRWRPASDITPPDGFPGSTTGASGVTFPRGAGSVRYGSPALSQGASSWRREGTLSQARTPAGPAASPFYPPPSHASHDGQDPFDQSVGSGRLPRQSTMGSVMLSPSRRAGQQQAGSGRSVRFRKQPAETRFFTGAGNRQPKDWSVTEVQQFIDFLATPGPGGEPAEFPGLDGDLFARNEVDGKALSRTLWSHREGSALAARLGLRGSAVLSRLRSRIDAEGKRRELGGSRTDSMALSASGISPSASMRQQSPPMGSMRRSMPGASPMGGSLAGSMRRSVASPSPSVGRGTPPTAAGSAPPLEPPIAPIGRPRRR
eukprot:TRINITY_DN5664_c0_g1_i3.p1 TRINITY_DN5664_c0_g1~~TRINITY_DN5664_c0_g1_i3.p1  ORF type:complete len:6126 (+),score=2081.50 TRINITY_DN5664_c0_g1_i3:132-18509(+)